MSTTSSTCPPEMHEALGMVQRIGGADLVRRMAGMFETSARERLGKLVQARAAGDLKQVSRVAHAIQGSAAQMGAEDLRQVAEALEAGVMSMGPAAVDQALTTVTAETERALAQLTFYLSTLETP